MVWILLPVFEEHLWIGGKIELHGQKETKVVVTENQTISVIYNSPYFDQSTFKVLNVA